MHEASLVRALLRQVEELMQQHRATGVKEVKVTVGEFSGVEPQLLESAFARQVPETLARGSQLVVERAALQAQCPACSHEFAIEHFRFVCPLCGNTELTITGGEELMLESVTMEADE